MAGDLASSGSTVLVKLVLEVATHYSVVLVPRLIELVVAALGTARHGGDVYVSRIRRALLSVAVTSGSITTVRNALFCVF